MKELPLIDHLDEIRKRLIFLVVIFVFSASIGMFFSKQILKRIIADFPVPSTQFVALTPFEFIYTQLGIGLVIGFILTLPFIIYEVLVFIRPALKNREKKAVKLILPSFLLLFAIGALFAYLILVRIALIFLAGLSQGIVLNMWSIKNFITFIIAACTTAGIVFQLPLIMVLLNKLGIVSIEFFRSKRKHIYTIIFIFAAIITPTLDIVNLILVAVPVIMLYEMTLGMMRIASNSFIR